MVEGLNKATYINLMFNNISRNQDSIGTLTKQISSGYTDFSYSDLAKESNVERVISFKSKISALDSFKSANSTVISRLNTASQSVTQLSDVATKFSSLLAKLRSPSGDQLPFENQTLSLLKETQSALNVQFDGQYLFSGSKTDTKPVADTVVTTTNVDGDSTTTANYYQGNNATLTVQASQTQSLSYGVTANNQAFQDLIGAMHLAIDANNSGDETGLQNATTLINSAVSGLASVNASIKNNAQILKNQNDTHDNTSLLLSQNLTDITQTDIVSATAKMQQLDSTIQASYYAFNILNNLNLTNYLK